MDSSLPVNSEVARLRLYVIVSASLLLLPLALNIVGLPSRQQVYKGLPAVRGDAGNVEAAIYEEPGDSDVVFVGSSTMCSAVRPVVVNQYFSKRLGRAADIKYLYLLRSRPDVHYLELRDYLQTHRTKLIVLAMPERFMTPNAPDVSLCDIYRYGEYPDLYQGVSLRERAAIYGEMVLNGPRQLLNALRPNVVSDHEKTQLGLDEDVAMRYGKIDLNAIHYESDGSRYTFFPSSPHVSFDNSKEGKGGYFALFFKKILALAKEHSVRVLLISLPMSRDPDALRIPVNIPKDVLDPGQPIVAVTKLDLFGDVSGKQAERKYYEDPQHLNAEGAVIFSAKAIPAIYSVFENQPEDTSAK